LLLAAKLPAFSRHHAQSSLGVVGDDHHARTHTITVGDSFFFHASKNEVFKEQKAGKVRTKKAAN
jgi:hypothetical protein